jgi:alpha-1,2-glucosyltransferase
MKYGFAPVYLYGLWAVWDELRQRGFVRATLFFAACVAVLVPQKLLEFRYFIVPFLLLRIQLQKLTFFQLILEFLLFQTVNGLTLFFFLNKPFKWAASPELQHFMW